MIAHFSNSILLNFLHLDRQRDGQLKFQFQKSRTFEVTVLQSGNSREIDLYSDNMESKTTQVPK